MTDGPAFFRAIEADPDEDTPRLVYADWLDENAASGADRARAEFVRVQCELARDPDPPRRLELADRERRLLTDFGRAWSPGWSVNLVSRVYCRGFLDPVTVAGPFFRGPEAEQLADRTPLCHLRLVSMLGDATKCPQLALARRLTLTGTRLQNPDMTALAASPYLATLRQLDLSGNRIGVRGATDLATARAPSLRELKLARNPIKDRGLLALALADWPAFESLDATECDLRFAPAALAESPLASRLVSLQLSRNPMVQPSAWKRLAAAPLHRLSRLDLSTQTVTDEVIETLAANPGLVNLRVLHLGSATSTERGARAILASPYLRGLTRVRLPEDGLDAVLREQLRAAFGAGFNPRA